MRVDPEDLRRYRRELAPVPPPIAPLLSAAEEAQVIADPKRADTVTRARRERLLAVLHRPAPPAGTDAALIALLAEAGALPVERDEDRVKARLRLVEIGRMKDPPPEVARLAKARRVVPGDGPGFADALMGRRQDVGAFRESGAGMHGVS